MELNNPHMMAELLKYHHWGEIKIPLQRKQIIEIWFSLMRVSAIGEGGLEMTELNDLIEENEEKYIFKNQNCPTNCHEKVYIAYFQGTHQYPLFRKLL